MHSLRLILATAATAIALAATGASGISAHVTTAPTTAASIATSVTTSADTNAAATVNADNTNTQRCFPPDFMFGSATAAYQVEGGWNETGRTPSIWDDFCREKQGLQCANVADDFLHRYRDDIQLMVASGLDSFRFSISWSRVMNWDARARQMVPNAPGIAFYHAVLDELRRNGITPILTLYHWDLPSELHAELTPRGWISSDIVDHFVVYADLMFREFGAKVDLWTTFNEPHSFIAHGYATGKEAPGMSNSKTNAYVVAHNVLVSHGKAVQRFRALKASGVIHKTARISIVLNHDYSVPLNPNDPMDVAASARKIEFILGWFLSPIVSGRYPDVMRERVGESLPQFTDDEAALVKGSYDLFMLNHYATKAVVDCQSPLSTVQCSAQTLGWESDLGIDDSRAPAGARLSSKNELGEYNCKWFTGYPAGYLETIKWMHAHDPSAEILLTENGWCGNDTVDNQDQLWYFQAYLAEVHKAVTELKIPIIGYTAWSFLDNYEWGSFKPRFGLYYVNFTAQTGQHDEVTPGRDALARIPRPAATWYAQVAKTKCLGDAATDVTGVAVISAVVLEASARVEQEASVLAISLVPGLLLALVFTVSALAVYVKRRQSARESTLLRPSEATPLVRTQ